MHEADIAIVGLNLTNCLRFIVDTAIEGYEATEWGNSHFELLKER